MHPVESDSPFRIFTHRSKKRTVRFLVSPSVMERIPFLEEVLMRAAAGVSFYEIAWPARVVITAYDDEQWVPGDSLFMRFPEWLFEKVDEARKKPRRWWYRLLVDPEIGASAWNIAWTLSHYLRPLQDSSRPQQHDAIFLRMAITVPFDYRPISTWMRLALFAPFVLAVLSIIIVCSFLFPRSRRLLRAKARVQLAFERRNGLNKTRQRLLDLGEPAETLKKFELGPELKVVDDDGEAQE